MTSKKPDLLDDNILLPLFYLPIGPAHNIISYAHIAQSTTETTATYQINIIHPKIN